MRERLRKIKFLYIIYIYLYRTFGRNRIKRGGSLNNNQIILSDAKLKRCVITIIGKNNTVKIGTHSLLKECSFIIRGDNCKISIGDKNTLFNTELVCEDDRSCIETGGQCICAGEAHFAATEGKKIEIGNNFLCSNAVTIRTGDSHSIYDRRGKRINAGKDVRISEHVWIGNQVIILKGTELEEDIVVGSGSVVMGCFPAHTVIAGNTAKIVKENIRWDFKR